MDPVELSSSTRSGVAVSAIVNSFRSAFAASSVGRRRNARRGHLNLVDVGGLDPNRAVGSRTLSVAPGLTA